MPLQTKAPLLEYMDIKMRMRKKKPSYGGAGKAVTLGGGMHTTLSPNLVGHEGLFKMVNSHKPDAKEVKNWKSGAVRRDIEK